VLEEALLYERVATSLHTSDKIGTQDVSVFLHELLASVLDRTSKVLNGKVCLPLSNHLEVLARAVCLPELIAPLLGVPSDGQALFVEHRQYPRTCLADHVDDGAIVGEIQGIPLNSLSGVQGFFVLEDHLVEVLLQKLIGVVDAQLLEGVELEELKAKDV
jgi:hypothetical protein